MAILLCVSHPDDLKIMVQAVRLIPTDRDCDSICFTIYFHYFSCNIKFILKQAHLLPCCISPVHPAYPEGISKVSFSESTLIKLCVTNGSLIQSACYSAADLNWMGRPRHAFFSSVSGLSPVESFSFSSLLI